MMNRNRARVDATVKDKKTAEALKPWYRAWCKRPLFNDEFLPCFNQPNVELVDTEGKGVERITEKGLVVNGQEYEVDCIVFATGFEVGTAYTRRAAFEVYGRGGQTLTDYWAHGMRTFHGFLAHGFPNCFHLGLTQTGLSPNFTYMLDGQTKHIVALMNEARARQAKMIEATAEAEEDWVTLIKQPNPFKQLIATCTPGYYNAEGKASDENPGIFDNVYAGGPVQFFELLENWRNEGSFKGLEIQ
jgi:cyclohexanone monooxygenase